MTITIITPTFNAAKYILPTANSILKMTQERIDLKINWLVLDNNSTDDITKLLTSQKYENLKCKIVVEADKGIYDAMNKGLDLCEPGHVMFLGAGDKVLGLPKNLEVQTIYYGTTIVDGDRYFVSSIDNFVFNSFSSLHHQSMLVPVSFHRYFNTNYKICADYAHNIEMMIEGRKFSFDPDLLAYHMPGGVSSDLAKTRAECQLIQQRTYQLATAKTLIDRI